MRTTITIPDEFHNRIKLMLASSGYTSLNGFLLDILRHQIDATKPMHQNDAKQPTHQNDAKQPTHQIDAKPVTVNSSDSQPAWTPPANLSKEFMARHANNRKRILKRIIRG